MEGNSELIIPLCVNPRHFIGRKPIAVLFGEERVEAANWRKVFIEILSRCNQEYHEKLMYLRDRAAGKIRRFISASPAGMSRPAKIDEEMYAETHYGSETLMHILCKQLLDPAGFDYSEIKIVIRA